MLKKHAIRASLEIAHLTDARRAGHGDEKRWPVEKLADVIRKVLITLGEKASPGRLSKEAMEAIDSRPDGSMELIPLGTVSKPSATAKETEIVTNTASSGIRFENGLGSIKKKG